MLALLCIIYGTGLGAFINPEFCHLSEDQTCLSVHDVNFSRIEILGVLLKQYATITEVTLGGMCRQDEMRVLVEYAQKDLFKNIQSLHLSCPDEGVFKALCACQKLKNTVTHLSLCYQIPDKGLTQRTTALKLFESLIALNLCKGHTFGEGRLEKFCCLLQDHFTTTAKKHMKEAGLTIYDQEQITFTWKTDPPTQEERASPTSNWSPLWRLIGYTPPPSNFDEQLTAGRLSTSQAFKFLCESIEGTRQKVTELFLDYEPHKALSESSRAVQLAKFPNLTVIKLRDKVNGYTLPPTMHEALNLVVSNAPNKGSVHIYYPDGSISIWGGHAVESDQANSSKKPDYVLKNNQILHVNTKGIHDLLADILQQYPSIKEIIFNKSCHNQDIKKLGELADQGTLNSVEAVSIDCADRDAFIALCSIKPELKAKIETLYLSGTIKVQDFIYALNGRLFLSFQNLRVLALFNHINDMLSTLFINQVGPHLQANGNRLDKQCCLCINDTNGPKNICGEIPPFNTLDLSATPLSSERLAMLSSFLQHGLLNEIKDIKISINNSDVLDCLDKSDQQIKAKITDLTDLRTDQAPQAALSSYLPYTNLKGLSISYTAGELEILKGLRSLTTLTIQGQSPLGADFSQKLRQLPVTGLNIEKRKITHEDIKELAALENLTLLTHLGFINCEINNPILRVIVDAFPRLNSLDLRGCSQITIGVLPLSKSTVLDNLRYLQPPEGIDEESAKREDNESLDAYFQRVLVGEGWDVIGDEETLSQIPVNDRPPVPPLDLPDKFSRKYLFQALKASPGTTTINLPAACKNNAIRTLTSIKNEYLENNFFKNITSINLSCSSEEDLDMLAKWSLNNKITSLAVNYPILYNFSLDNLMKKLESFENLSKFMLVKNNHFDEKPLVSQLRHYFARRKGGGNKIIYIHYPSGYYQWKSKQFFVWVVPAGQKTEKYDQPLYVIPDYEINADTLYKETANETVNSYDMFIELLQTYPEVKKIVINAYTDQDVKNWKRLLGEGKFNGKLTVNQ